MKLLLPFIALLQMQLFSMRPVPWLTEGAIEFLEIFFEENDNPKILEFGSGASTVWMSKRTKNLYSVEHHAGWHKKVIDEISTNALCNSAVCYLRKKPYYSICKEFDDEFFDLILVDGRNRKGCIVGAISKLKPGGVLMLDNSERKRYQSVYALMNSWKMARHIQEKPDSCGFYHSGWETRWWKKPID